MLRGASRWLVGSVALLAMQGSARGQDFVRLNEQEVAQVERRVHRVTTRRGPVRIEGARVIRRVRKEEQELRPWDERPLGQPLCLAADPAGPLLVAASSGLYLADVESDVLDPVELREGAPPGAPTGVFIDSTRRVWVSTEEAFGVLDPAFFWGRTFGPSDGLPPGPYRLAFDGGDEPIVETPEGFFRYVPSDSTPTLDGLQLDGIAWERDQEKTLAYGAVTELSASGSGLGGASFRWRLDRHHVWLPLEGTVQVASLSPGRRRLEVIAIDRELRRSVPIGVVLDVAYPVIYSPTVFLLLAFAALAAILAGFTWKAKRSARGRALTRSERLRVLLSTAIAFGLGLQIVAAAFPHGRGWPFIGFSMYTRSFHEGDLIHEGVLTGLGTRGRPRSLPYLAAGVATDGRWNVLRALIDGGDSAGEALIESFNERHPEQPLIGVQVRSRRVRLTEHGPVRVAPLILSHYRRAEDNAEESTDGDG